LAQLFSQQQYLRAPRKTTVESTLPCSTYKPLKNSDKRTNFIERFGSILQAWCRKASQELLIILHRVHIGGREPAYGLALKRRGRLPRLNFTVTLAYRNIINQK
jgi:hypothetical protein